MLINWDALKSFVDAKSISIQWVDIGGKYFLKAFDGPLCMESILIKTDPSVGDQLEFETSYKSSGNKSPETSVNVITEPIIVAAPFRTKMHATDELLTVEPGEMGTVDWKLPEDLYIQGGSTLLKNVEVGDWMSAMVVDVDGIIPEAYRAYVCEDWPIVAKYVVKEWVGGENVREIDTTPLSTKIPKNLYMRVEYHACDAGETRKIGVNYFFVRKLT